jgi:alkylation response protein AidB-like acyl-CoA dehydrogenase
LNGAKTFTTHGSVADLTIVFAVTDPDLEKKGISAFAIEKGTPGFRAGKKENKMGLRASDTAEVIMEDCLVPASAMVGARGEGFVDAMKILDGGRISIAALALGMARGAYEAGARLFQAAAPVRQTDLRVPGGATHAGRDGHTPRRGAALVYRAAWMKDTGRRPRSSRRWRSSTPPRSASTSRIARSRIFGGYGLRQGLPRREFLPRHEAVHDRRRDQRDPAPRDRARAACKAI